MGNNLVARFFVDISDLNKNHELTPLNTFLDLLMDRIDALEAKVAELEQRPTKEIEDISDLENRLEDIESKLEDLEQSKLDDRDFDDRFITALGEITFKPDL